MKVSDVAPIVLLLAVLVSVLRRKPYLSCDMFGKDCVVQP